MAPEGGGNIVKGLPPVLIGGGFEGGGISSISGCGCGMFCGIPKTKGSLGLVVWGAPMTEIAECGGLLTGYRTALPNSG